MISLTKTMGELCSSLKEGKFEGIKFSEVSVYNTKYDALDDGIDPNIYAIRYSKMVGLHAPDLVGLEYDFEEAVKGFFPVTATVTINFRTGEVEAYYK